MRIGPDGPVLKSLNLFRSGQSTEIRPRFYRCTHRFLGVAVVISLLFLQHSLLLPTDEGKESNFDGYHQKL